MANKRSLKKFINNTSRELAFDTFIADCALSNPDEAKFEALLHEIDSFHSQALAAASFSFDKTPSSFDSKKEYNKARKAYFKKAYAKFFEEYRERLQKIVDSLNALEAGEAKK